MKKLIFVTSNKWKFKQADQYFRKRGVTLKHINMELPESRNDNVVEISKEKAEFAFESVKKPLFVIDAALHIKALKDFPKTYVKFIEEHLGAEGILKLLEGEKDRTWEFPNVVYYKDDKIEKHFVGVIKGSLANKLHPSREGLIRDFQRIQIPECYNKTYSEMSQEEEDKFRNKIWKPIVFDKFIKWFKQKQTE